MRRFGRCAAAALVAAVASAAGPVGLGDVERLAAQLTGSFGNAAQAAADPSFRSVVMHVVRVWPERSDGIWLYVEQAAAETPAAPYRQRVLHLTGLGPGVVQSRVLELADPDAAVGAWRAAAPLAGVDPARLLPRTGCEVVLRRVGEGFVGSTLADLCASSLRGASWATSEVHVSSDGFASWDRGWDAGGVQVWGSSAGPYRFERLAADETEGAAEHR